VIGAIVGNRDEVEIRGYRGTKRAKVFEVDTPTGSSATAPGAGLPIPRKGTLSGRLRKSQAGSPSAKRLPSF